ncbi:hypothetical protein D9756_011637 [Leucocoprinus leucothites]|uniref:Endonuclease/exonuclease/phosphatase domain-containing protein n=1 Tax=Leucocoprinus leucothites TaxID=201217 RepID=A0A8H5CL69_9AGAR|nr:hypothetical protein D9756_011637 [Leucoagaricus leucothites]
MTIGSLNIRGGRYEGKRSKYPNITTLVRKNKIMVLGIQETKLAEHDHIHLMNENPKIIIEQNSGDREAGVAFILNKDLLDWDNSKPLIWQHTKLITGCALLLTIQWENKELNLMNLYAPNELKDKIEFFASL